jgi:outer membrane protein OmpA-like peptidoglycan-associated protein/tetratricopeptide (TPR) repeat protein
MKKNYITFSLLFLVIANYAQNKFTEKADKLFQSYQYVSAIDAYLKLATTDKADQYIYTQLADSYYNVFNIEEASKWYAKAVEGNATAETYFRYAQTLKSLGKYQEANKQMDSFSRLMPNDSRAIAHKANPNYIPSLANKSKLFDIAETIIKGEGQSNFAPVLDNANILYFVSTRNTAKKKDKWTNQPYLDIFQSTRNADGTLSEATAVNELNTPFHDGPVTLSRDGNTMFFARDGHSENQYKKNKVNSIKVGQQGLYKAIKVDGKWSQIEALPFNSTSYSVSNPSLSKDGKTLYFGSNMPGGLGESDIWKVTVDGNSYGKPENLGTSINTAGKENFPFIAYDNVLYFASSGRQGLGGLDIFKVDLKSSGQPQNIGKPVNTEKDDFSFSYNDLANVGYFSSNRSGFDAIYSAISVCAANAIAIVTNQKTGAPLANASVSILDTKGNVIATKETNSEGKVSYDIDCETAYSFQIAASNFESAVYPIQKVKSGEVIVKAQLEPTVIIITDSEVLLKPVYFDFDKSNITALGADELNKLIKVMNDNPSMVIFVKSHTDFKGSEAYNLKLSEQRAQVTVQYLLSKGIDSKRISGKGFGSSEPKIKCFADCTETEDAQNRRSEFVIVKK